MMMESGVTIWFPNKDWYRKTYPFAGYHTFLNKGEFIKLLEKNPNRYTIYRIEGPKGNKQMEEHISKKNYKVRSKLVYLNIAIENSINREDIFVGFTILEVNKHTGEVLEEYQTMFNIANELATVK